MKSKEKRKYKSITNRLQIILAPQMKKILKNMKILIIKLTVMKGL
jgi:hypothetical protein